MWKYLFIHRLQEEAHTSNYTYQSQVCDIVNYGNAISKQYPIILYLNPGIHEALEELLHGANSEEHQYSVEHFADSAFHSQHRWSSQEVNAGGEETMTT